MSLNGRWKFNWVKDLTKALLHASDMFHMMQSCDEFGVSTDFISFDFGKMQKYKKKAVVKYRDGIQYGFEKLNVEIVYGTAVLRRDRTVEVELGSVIAVRYVFPGVPGRLLNRKRRHKVQLRHLKYRIR